MKRNIRYLHDVLCFPPATQSHEHGAQGLSFVSPTSQGLGKEKKCACNQTNLEASLEVQSKHFRRAGYREKEGLQSKRLTASLFIKEKKFI
eukprot:1160536-Pelagomonas_calceolata.AAC.1